MAASPSRVLDTRVGLGAPKGKVAPGTVLRLALPQAGSATSVVLNLTATEADGPGWVRVWPCGAPEPATSALNYTTDENVANAVAVQVTSATVCMSTYSPVHLVADLSGWFDGTADFQGTTPNRILDTRLTGDPLIGGVERRIKVAGTPNIPAGAGIAALNITVASPAAAGWVVAYPCGQQTNASTVNFDAGSTIANLTLVGLGDGDVCVRSWDRTDIVVDTYGWSSGSAALRSQSPRRLLDTRDPASWPFGEVAASSRVSLRVAGREGVPNDAAGALLNVTVTDVQSPSFVTVWPCDAPLPTASTLNADAGQLRSNLSLVHLAADGTACLQVTSPSGTPLDMVVDVIGWETGGPTRSAPPATPAAPVPAAPAAPAAPPAAAVPAVSSLPGGTVPAGAAGLTSTDCGSAGAAFCEGFSDPAAFAARFDHGWSGELHAGSLFAGDKNGWPGDHDMMCGNPNMTNRTVTLGAGNHGEDSPASSSDPAFYSCLPGGDPAKGHLMTSANTEGYAIAWFSPKQTFTNVRKVCFDNNLNYIGNGIWFQLVFVSAAEAARKPVIDGTTYNTLDLGYTSPDFPNTGGPSTPQGTASTGVKFMVNDPGTGQPDFIAHAWDNSQWQSTPVAAGSSTTDKAPRYQICVSDNENGTLTLVNASPDGTVHTNTMPGAIPAGAVRVVFEQDEYNPDKHHDNNGGVATNTGEGYTYHWDNTLIYTR